MSEQKFLVTYSSNWADEINVDGFCVMTETEKNAYFDLFKRVFKEEGYYTFSVGTNEEIEYNGLSDFKRDFTIEKITEEDAEVLVRVIGSFGFFPDMETAAENAGFYDEE